MFLKRLRATLGMKRPKLTHGGLTPPARGMAKQLTPTARPAAGPQRVRADGQCVLLPAAAVVVFMEFLALELNNNLVSHHNNACLFLCLRTQTKCTQVRKKK